MFTDLTCTQFIDALASKAPVPGGGGASALCGALGAALGSMVANLTLGKKKYAAVEPQIQSALQDCAQLQQRFIDLIQADADAFAPLADAYRLPKDTEEQRTYKQFVIEIHLQAAAEAPLAIMQAAVDAIRLMDFFAQNGSAAAVSDAGTGAALCRAALEGAALNVLINTKAMANRERAKALNAQTEALLTEGRQAAESVYASVAARLRT